MDSDIWKFSCVGYFGSLIFEASLYLMRMPKKSLEMKRTNLMVASFARTSVVTVEARDLYLYCVRCTCINN